MRASFVFSEVITGLRRNITMTIAMILTTAVSLGLLGGGLIVMNVVGQMQAQFYSKAEVSVYLTDAVSANDTSCSQETCSELRTNLESNPAVKSVTFENRDHVYQRFQEIFSAQPELLKLTRPEALPATMHVKLNDPARSDVVVSQYKGKPGVKDVNDQGEFLQDMFDALTGARNLVFVIAVVAALAALLLIGNMIQLSAFTRRKEIGIMRLVGASRWYTQLPFLLEAVVAGVIGAVLAIGGLFGLMSAFIEKILASPMKSGIVPQLGFGDVVTVSPWLLLVSILISAVTGYGTLRLYVRL